MRHELPDHRDGRSRSSCSRCSGRPGLLWRLASRIVAIPVIAAIAYEALRLGARFPDSLVMRALMAPGIWLQKITTQQPDDDQIEVAVASFQRGAATRGRRAGRPTADARYGRDLGG